MARHGCANLRSPQDYDDITRFWRHHVSRVQHLQLYISHIVRLYEYWDCLLNLSVYPQGWLYMWVFFLFVCFFLWMPPAQTLFVSWIAAGLLLVELLRVTQLSSTWHLVLGVVARAFPSSPGIAEGGNHSSKEIQNLLIQFGGMVYLSIGAPAAPSCMPKKCGNAIAHMQMMSVLLYSRIVPANDCHNLYSRTWTCLFNGPMSFNILKCEFLRL